MASQAHRRQVLLFVVAVLLPCSVLVALGVRIVAQERELSENRLAEAQQNVVHQAHSDLLARLERIKLQVVAPFPVDDPPSQNAVREGVRVVFVARLHDNYLVPPWDDRDRSELTRRRLEEAEYAAAIGEGERRELITKEFGGAISWYQQGLQLSRHPVQGAYARLMLGRALTKAGRLRDATTHYRAVLSVPSDVTDDIGMPLWLYAATRLVEAGVDLDTVLARVRAEASTERWFSPPEVYLFRDLAIALAGAARDLAFGAAIAELNVVLTRHVSLIENTLALQRDLGGLGITRPLATRSGHVDPQWMLYGTSEWLVSVASQVGRSEEVAVVVVNSKDAFASVEDTRATAKGMGALRLVSGNLSGGRLLGPSFPGIRAEFVASEGTGMLGDWNLQRSFYWITLLLVLSVTFFGAYLLWRDVRRELRLAELRSQFVSGVSHELKTPLTAIRMFAETLRMRRSTDPRVQDEYLDTIVNESERLTRLLNNVLDFSKIEQGQKQYRRDPASLAEIVRATATAMESSLQQQGFELHVDVTDDLPSVNVDRDAIEQAILNLLTNAMKYSGESSDIDLRLSKANGYALIEVSDHGVGIDPEEQTRIFQRFYRAPTPENEHIPGTGLGLALVEHIAKAHGGYVAVESIPTKGSTFSLHLPLEPSES